jgi:ParB family chromosome partitioning protein
MSTKQGSTGAMFAALAAEKVAVAESPQAPSETKDVAGGQPPNLGLFTGRESAIRAAATGKRFNRITRRVSPDRCRIWERHNRRYELLSEESCADLIEGFRTKGGQEFPAVVRVVTGDEKYDYEVICGARRHWTATHLKMDLLIEERDLSDEEAFVLSDKENRDRKDISDYERALDYVRALDLYYDGVQSRMAKIIGMDPSVLSRYLDMTRLDPSIVSAVADVREISRNQVRELKAAMEPGIKLSQRQAEKNRQAILSKARELAAEMSKRPAQEVFRALLAAAASEKTKRGRPSALLGSVQSRVTGKVAVIARSKGRGSLVLELFGESRAPREEVIEAIKAFVSAHYKPVE